MSIHKEIHLEDEICADLTAAGWLYDAARWPLRPHAGAVCR
jgi:hypothetical protein